VGQAGCKHRSPYCALAVRRDQDWFAGLVFALEFCFLADVPEEEAGASEDDQNEEGKKEAKEVPHGRSLVDRGGRRQ